MQRTLTPEILDSLDSSHPDAQGSRRDLRIINRLMGNWRWIEKQLPDLPAENQYYCEIGAGDGALAVHLINKLKPPNYLAMDIVESPTGIPKQLDWRQTNLLTSPDYGDSSHLIASLILHHFDAEELGQIGKDIADSSVRYLVVCEPCRRNWHKYQLAAGRLIGFNRVTLHDGRVSIEAGFRGDELPELLGLDANTWRWEITETFMGAYRMVAKRR
ncbi:MAG: hypothetical protein ACSHYA_07005 [Opitutaceae bacterium]